MFWAMWYQDHRYMKWMVPPLIAGFFDVFIVLSILLSVYSSDLSVYRMSHVATTVLCLGGVLIIFSLLWYDFHVFRMKRLGMKGAGELNQYFGEGGQGVLFIVLWVLSGGCSLLSMIDSREGS
jgi:hypothetical protein